MDYKHLIDPRDRISDELLRNVCLIEDEEITLSFYGYILAGDKVFTLRKQYSHGILGAALFPKLANACGYRVPYLEEKYPEVFFYQKFDLGPAKLTPSIRIVPPRMFSSNMTISINGPVRSITDKEKTHLRKIFKQFDYKNSKQICLEYADMSVSKFFKSLEKEKGHDKDYLEHFRECEMNPERIKRISEEYLDIDEQEEPPI